MIHFGGIIGILCLFLFDVLERIIGLLVTDKIATHICLMLKKLVMF